MCLCVAAGTTIAPGPGATHAATASFLCQKLRTWVERSICASDSMAALDLELAVERSRLLGTTHPDSRKAFDAEQRKWQASLEECRRRSRPEECLTGRYQHRIAALRNHPDQTGQAGEDTPPGAGTESLVARGKGWTRDLSTYMRALGGCREEAPAPIGKLLVAWPVGDPDTVGMRLMDWNRKEWVCVAHRNGHKVFRFGPRAEGESLPAPGPVYHLGGRAPPTSCTGATQVVDASGKPAGWISDEDC